MALRPRPQRLSIQEVINQINSDDSDFGSDSESDDDFCPDQHGLDPNDQDSNSCSTDDNNSQYSESDDEPLARLTNQQKRKSTKKTAYLWEKKGYVEPVVNFTGSPVEPTDATGITESPLQYFQRFFTADMLELIADNTNLYSSQKLGPDKCVKTSAKEIELIIGIFLRMGLVEMTGTRNYWETETRFGPVADVMSRNRFLLLLSVIHFVNNDNVSEEDRVKDKLWKLRPFLKMFRDQCLLLTPTQHQAVDEQMVPYKGKFSGIRQYIKGKPNPWGFKVWARCDSTGLLHDFSVYQGKNDNTKIDGLGLSSSVVIRLCETLPDHCGFKVLADNLFTSIELIQKLLDRGIYYVGTVRNNRVGKCPLPNEKALKKEGGKGSYKFFLEKNSNIICLRWLDTKPVTLMSSYVRPDPIESARRWDKIEKGYRDIDRPHSPAANCPHGVLQAG